MTTKEQRRAYARDWYHKNKDRRKEYLLGQRQRYADLRREWRSNNRMKDALAAIKCRCKKHNIPFDLEEEDLEVPDYCPVFNWIKLSWGDGRESIPSVDRIIPDKGYIKGNVQVISMRANRIKSDASVEELIALSEYAKKFSAH